MSVNLIKLGNAYNSALHAEYQLASEADFADLPGLDKCAIGSIAYTHDLSKVWILGEDKQWHEV